MNWWEWLITGWVSGVATLFLAVAGVVYFITHNQQLFQRTTRYMMKGLVGGKHK